MTRPFLEAVFGSDGAAALMASADRGTVAVQDAVGRAAISWAREALAGRRPTVPGFPSLTLFVKGERWEVRGGGSAPLAGHGEAGLAAVALHLWDLVPDAPAAPAAALQRLGKALDRLARTAHLQKTSMDHGPAHSPQEPEGPVEPTPPDPTQTAPTARAAGKPKVSLKPKLPKKPKKPQVAVRKSDLERLCRVCRRSQLAGGRLVGCTCWSPMAKSLGASYNNDVVTITFGNGWDSEAVAAFIDAVRNRA